MKALVPTTLLALMLTVAGGLSKKEPVEASAEMPAAASRQATPDSGKVYEAAPEASRAPDGVHAT